MAITRALLAGTLLLTFAASPALAEQRDQVHVIPEFTFESGETLADMEVGYSTYGELNEARDNAVLVTHGTSGGRNSYNLFIGPGKAFDTDRYFVVTVDAIGGGLSSQPADGLGTDFPRYTIRDMMHAQHHLVTEELGLDRLLAVGGASMGSFQALEWGIHHPDMVDGLLLIVPAGRSEQLFASIVDTMIAAIELDPQWQDGAYEENPREGLVTAGMVFFPWLWSDEWLSMLTTEEEYEQALRSFGQGWADNWDAVSWKYRYLASRGHDVAAPFEGNLDQALGEIKARALIMPSPTDRLIPPGYARELYRGIQDATYVEIPSIRGHLACCPGDEEAMEYHFISERVSGFLDTLHK
jgi:homoserine O-acetyltransferase/O-succinyltransferase